MNIRVKTSTISDGDMKYASESEKNRKVFLQKNGFGQNLITLKQMHSDIIHEITKIGEEKKKGDGMLTQRNDVTLGIYTADCIPLVFATKTKVCLVHAGYKGILKKIHLKALTNFQNRQDIQVYIGPSISRCCYDVPTNRLKMFQKHSDILKTTIAKKEGKTYISLADIVKQDLLNTGISQKNIQVTKRCTKCSNKHFSFRRQNKLTGLNLTAVQLT